MPSIIRMAEDGTKTYLGRTPSSGRLLGCLPINEAAEKYGIGYETLRKLIAEGVLPFYLDGTRVMVMARVVKRLAETKNVTLRKDVGEVPPDGVPINQLARELETSEATIRRWLREPHPALGRPVRSGIGPYIAARRRGEGKRNNGQRARVRGLIVSRADVEKCVEATKEPFWRPLFNGRGEPNPGVWKDPGVFLYKPNTPEEEECYTNRYILDHDPQFGFDPSTLKANEKVLTFYDVGWPGNRGENWTVLVYTKSSLDKLRARRRGEENGGEWSSDRETWKDARTWDGIRLIVRKLGLKRTAGAGTRLRQLAQKLKLKMPESKLVPLGGKGHRGGRTRVYLHEEVYPLFGKGTRGQASTPTAVAEPIVNGNLLAGGKSKGGRPPSPAVEEVDSFLYERWFAKDKLVAIRHAAGKRFGPQRAPKEDAHVAMRAKRYAVRKDLPLRAI